MSYKNSIYINFYIIFAVLSFSSAAHAWNPFGPNNFEDCVLDGIKNAKSDQAANAVIGACRIKFPNKTAPAPTINYDPPVHNLFSTLGNYRPTLNTLISNISINQSQVVQTGSNTYGIKSYDYGHHLSIEVTNRNDFPIQQIEIGLNSKTGKCGWDDKEYTEIYSCSGSTNPRASSVYTCSIPRIESRKVRFCITGFGFYGNEADVTTFKNKYSIPNRN